MSQVQYSVTMVRPDRRRVVNRHLFSEQPIVAASDRQLAGFLTHRLFGDHERGKDGTYYTVTIRTQNIVRVFTVGRKLGNYLHA